MSEDSSVKKDTAAAALRKRIICGGYRSGELLSECRIARDLSLSLMPIRTAIAQLECERLVTVQPRVGTFVYRPTRSEAAELIKARLATETFIARDLAKSGKDISSARALHRQMCDIARKRPYSEADILEFAELDGRFHCELAACAGYEHTFAPVLLSFRNRFRLIALPSEQSFAKQTSDEHENILRAIGRKPGKGGAEKAAFEAAVAVREHIQNSVQRWRLQPEYREQLSGPEFESILTGISTILGSYLGMQSEESQPT